MLGHVLIMLKTLNVMKTKMKRMMMKMEKELRTNMTSNAARVREDSKMR